MVDEKKNKNMAMVSLLQFVFSIAVIIVHSGRLFESDSLHFLAKSVFGRMAVPYFMVCSTFFLRSYALKGGRVKDYFQGLVKKYLIWSALYLPYGYSYFSSLNLPKPYLLPGLLVALLYTGISYQLWYIPALIFGWFLLQAILRLFGRKVTGLLVILLYAFGALETYSLFVENTALGDFFTSYLSIFQTSRNFLFYAPAYIYAGCLLYDSYQSAFLEKYGRLFLVLSGLGLALESTVIYFNQGIDKNFIFFSLPFAFFLFNFSLRTTVFAQFNFSKLRQLSGYYYFIHPLFIESFLFLLKDTHLLPHERGLLVFLLTLATSHLASEILLLSQNVWRKKAFGRV